MQQKTQKNNQKIIKKLSFKKRNKQDVFQKEKI